MLRSKSSRHAVTRPGFARGGAINTEYLFAGALALVILGALALTIYFSFFRKSTGLKTELPTVYQFRCVECGHEFTIDVEDLPSKAWRARGAVPMHMDCPKCGVEDAAAELYECPKCKKYYLPPAHLDPESWQEGLLGADVCEHCVFEVCVSRRAGAAQAS